MKRESSTFRPYPVQSTPVYFSDFYVLTYPYQCVLVTEAIYSFTLIQLSVDFDLDRDEYNYFDFTKQEREIILRHFPSYEVICQHLVESGRLIKMCALDHVELALLSYLEFVRGGEWSGCLVRRYFFID